MTQLIGVETYQIPHVEGKHTEGYQLLYEKETSIVALMRGGEAMALGVSQAFPLAMFVRANAHSDIKPHHLMRRVILVDSVVNSGATVVEFVQHIRSLNSTKPVVVATGVAQAHSVSENLSPRLDRFAEVSLVTLRLSDNKFKGSGATDTGNRLFNTTHLT